MTTNNKSVIAEKPVWFITGCSTGFGLLGDNADEAARGADFPREEGRIPVLA